MPDFALERAAGGLVAGVDEAGRGPLAGPVVAAAAILQPGDIPAGLDDSKRLSPARREALFPARCSTAPDPSSMPPEAVVTAGAPTWVACRP